MSLREGARFAAAVALVLGAVAFVASCGKKAEQTSTPPAAAPDPAQLAQLERGHQAFLAYCGMCHGLSGAGDGPLAPGLASSGAPAPPNLANAERIGRLGPDGVKRIVRQGGGHTGRSNLMPAWGEVLPPSVINDITAWVVRLPEQSPGIPTATVEKYLSAPPGSPDDGRHLFVFYCTGCHGPFGKGDGFNADSLRAKHNIRPRDLTDSTYFAGRADKDLYSVIALGGGHLGKSVFMPAWTYTFEPAQIQDLVAYVRSISRTSTTP
jgi:mono/diheme cytochrome c family protein